MCRAHEILGVPSDATPQQIRKAYLAGAIRSHPDKGGSAHEFNEVRRAYEQLLRVPPKPKSRIHRDLPRSDGVSLMVLLAMLAMAAHQSGRPDCPARRAPGPSPDPPQNRRFVLFRFLLVSLLRRLAGWMRKGSHERFT